MADIAAVSKEWTNSRKVQSKNAAHTQKDGVEKETAQYAGDHTGSKGSVEHREKLLAGKDFGEIAGIVCIQHRSRFYSEYRCLIQKHLKQLVNNFFIILKKHKQSVTQLSHKQMTAGLNHCGENQEEKRRVDNQAGTQFAESNLLKNGRKRV